MPLRPKLKVDWRLEDQITSYMTKQGMVVIESPPMLLTSRWDGGEAWRVFYPSIFNLRFISDSSENYKIGLPRYRLLPNLLSEETLPYPLAPSKKLSDRIESAPEGMFEYTRVVRTEPITPLVGKDEDSDRAVDNWLKETRVSYGDFKTTLKNFSLEMLRNNAYPNYLAMVDWVNWGIKENEQHRWHKGLCYMNPKMWTKDEFLAFIPELPQIRRTLSGRQRDVLDNMLSEEIKIRGIL